MRTVAVVTGNGRESGLVELNRIFCDKQISPYLPNPAL
jgi:hypothetical protein